MTGAAPGFRLDSRETIFPIYLWRYRVDGHEALNAGLLAEVAARRSAEPGTGNRMSRFGWQSERDLFRRSEPAQARLAGLLERLLGEAVEGLAGPGALAGMELVANGWINVNPPGGYNAPHVHPEALLSGVYYVAVPPAGANPAGGMIEFNVPHPTLKLAHLAGLDMLAERVRVAPEPGLLLLFPGTLSHWVHPNDSAGERVSISFNATLRPKRPSPAAGARPGS